VKRKSNTTEEISRWFYQRRNASNTCTCFHRHENLLTASEKAIKSFKQTFCSFSWKKLKVSFVPILNNKWFLPTSGLWWIKTHYLGEGSQRSQSLEISEIQEKNRNVQQSDVDAEFLKSDHIFKITQIVWEEMEPLHINSLDLSVSCCSALLGKNTGIHTNERSHLVISSISFKATIIWPKSQWMHSWLRI